LEKQEEFLTKLANRTIEYFNTDLEVAVEKYFGIVDVAETSFDDITSLIGLSNGLNAVVGMSVSSGLSSLLLKKVLDFEIEDENEEEELRLSNIAEILNTTLGNILVDFEQDDEIKITPPKLLQKKMAVIKKESGHMQICILRHKNEAITLSLFA
jgi:CheY-specific phosphatase CheX